MKRMMVTVDEGTVRLLERLARPRGGNKSYVVREAVKLMAREEAFDHLLDEIEQDPELQASMARAEEDVRLGRLVPHEDALRLITAAGRHRLGEKAIRDLIQQYLARRPARR